MEAELKHCYGVKDVLKRFTVEKLKNFLRERDLNLSGDKKLLAEKVFGAHKLDLTKSTTREEDEKTKALQKKERLVLEEGVIKLPFPSDLKVGWQKESTNFPDTTENDVEKYLEENGLKAKVKGSSLLDSHHVVDAEFHTISPNIKYCFVRGRCIPQERTNNKPYEMWVCLKKDDGGVVTAECSCVAGYVFLLWNWKVSWFAELCLLELYIIVLKWYIYQ